MKILLPVDGSDYTKRMLAHIAAHDELLGAGHEYIALHVVVPLTGLALRILDRSSVDDYYREQSEDVLKPVMKFAEQHGWNVQAMRVAGQPAEAIAMQAQESKVDLIVMGTHGRAALGGLVLGSVATGVLARCQVPVLLIR